MRRFPRIFSRRLSALTAACLLVLAVGLSLPWTTLERIEALTIDARHRLVAPGAAPASVVLVEIADSSFALAETAPREVATSPVLAALCRPWPWDRRVFAAVVRQLRAAGARAIVFDVVFAATTDGDAEFATALAEPGAPVLLASLYQASLSAEGEQLLRLFEPREAFLAPRSVSTGLANLQPDDDGVVRRLPLAWSEAEALGLPPTAGSIAESPGRRLPTLAAATLRALGQVPPRPDTDYLSFRLPPGGWPRVPIENLFLADRWQGSVIDHGRLFRDRIVCIGPVSDVRFKDYHATPRGRLPGAELHLHAITGWLEGHALRRSGAGAAAACVGALVFAALLILLAGGRARWQLLGLLALGLAWLGLASAAFAWGHLLLPIAAPLSALLGSTLIGVGLRYVAEQRERRRTRRLLATYVSEHVAHLVLQQPEEFEQALRGDRRPVTVLFADIRNFSAWVEATPPDLVVAQLNEHLGALVDCVLATDGTLQKFIGDAILAVWGDTHTAGEANDARRAVAAALAMERAVARLNAGWARRPDRRALRLGIGLEQGPAMVGHIGHPRRREFTVLGETVNLASRFESATKRLGAPILVGDRVRVLTDDAFHFAFAARLQVAGSSKPRDVFAPVSESAAPAPAWLAPHAAATAALLAGDFSTAAAAFAALPAVESRLASLVAWQGQLAATLAATPPAKWDGTVRWEEK